MQLKRKINGVDLSIKALEILTQWQTARSKSDGQMSETNSVNAVDFQIVTEYSYRKFEMIIDKSIEQNAVICISIY